MNALFVAMLLTQFPTTGIAVKDEGVAKGSAGTVNCTGAGVTCSVGPGGVWTLDGAAGGGGGAPTTASYWTKVAEAGLSNEIALGTLGSGLILNTTTTGVPTIYGGSSCTGANLVQTTSAAGVHTCYQLKLSQLANPAGDTTFTFPSGAKQLYTFTGSTDVAFSIDGDGAFTGTGDLVHMHKSGTGSAFGADLLHLEVTSDTNMTGLRLTMPSTSAVAVNQIGSSFISGTVNATSFVGPLTGNASTASAFDHDPADCSAGQAPLGITSTGAVSGCFTPAGTYVLPDAAAAVTGGVRLTGDFGGTATSPTVPALASRSGTGACGANTWASTLNGAAAPTCTQPAFSNLSGSATAAQIPTASTTLGGVKMAAACAANNHVSSIVAGELTCSADGGAGGGADALGRYLVQIATNAPANAQIMGSLGTGLVTNTTTTGVQSIYGGTSCTNQFPRSLNASGAATCASLALADFTPNLGTTTTVLHGNAAGQPSFVAVNMLSDTTADLLSIAKGGNNSSATPTTGGVHYGTGTGYATTAAGSATQVLIGGASAPSFASVNLLSMTTADVLSMAKGGTGANLTGTTGGVHYSSSSTATTQTAGGAAGTILQNASANTPAWLAAGTAGQVLRSAGAGSLVYVGVQTCTSSASTTCTITVARSGCTPVCGMGSSASTWVRGTVSTTTLTCTFSTSGTNTCNCFCP